jgi:hypothetical protein
LLSAPRREASRSRKRSGSRAARLPPFSAWRSALRCSAPATASRASASRTTSRCVLCILLLLFFCSLIILCSLFFWLQVLRSSIDALRGGLRAVESGRAAAEEEARAKRRGRAFWDDVSAPAAQAALGRAETVGLVQRWRSEAMRKHTIAGAPSLQELAQARRAAERAQLEARRVLTIEYATAARLEETEQQREQVRARWPSATRYKRVVCRLSALVPASRASGRYSALRGRTTDDRARLALTRRRVFLEPAPTCLRVPTLLLSSPSSSSPSPSPSPSPAPLPPPPRRVPSLSTIACDARGCARRLPQLHAAVAAVRRAVARSRANRNAPHDAQVCLLI